MVDSPLPDRTMTNKAVNRKNDTIAYNGTRNVRGRYGEGIIKKLLKEAKKYKIEILLIQKKSNCIMRQYK